MAGSSVGPGGLPSCWGFFVGVVCTLFILDPGLLRPGIGVPGIGQPSLALVHSCSVLFCLYVDFCEVMGVGRCCVVARDYMISIYTTDDSHPENPSRERCSPIADISPGSTFNLFLHSN